MYHKPINFLDTPIHTLPGLTQKMAKYSPELVLTNEFIKYINFLDLSPKIVQIFSYKPGQNLGIHVDDKVLDNKAKFNFIIGGINSTVEWWIPKAHINKSVDESAMGTLYLKYEEYECDLAESVNLVGLHAINAGQPHRVKNPETYRICVSVPLFFKGTDTQIQFKELLERL